MKKITRIAALLIVCCGLVSCEKSWNCVCESKTYYNSNVISKTSSTKKVKGDYREAGQACDQFSTYNKENGYIYATNCNLK